MNSILTLKDSNFLLLLTLWFQKKLFWVQAAAQFGSWCSGRQLAGTSPLRAGQLVEDISGHLEHPWTFLTPYNLINPDKLTWNVREKSCVACRIFSLLMETSRRSTPISQLFKQLADMNCLVCELQYGKVGRVALVFSFWEKPEPRPSLEAWWELSLGARSRSVLLKK